jgi:hypothetical protein
VMSAARKFANQLQAIGEQLFGALEKGAMPFTPRYTTTWRVG